MKSMKQRTLEYMRADYESRTSGIKDRGLRGRALFECMMSDLQKYCRTLNQNSHASAGKVRQRILDMNEVWNMLALIPENGLRKNGFRTAAEFIWGKAIESMADAARISKEHYEIEKLMSRGREL